MPLCIYRLLMLTNYALLPLLNHASAITKQLSLHEAVKDSAHDVFIKVVSSNQVIYAGEPFIVKYQLYSSVDITDPGTEVVVNFNNCYQESYSTDNQQSTKKINGKLYKVIILKKYLVIAANSGRLELPELKIHIKINSPAKDDFWQQEEQIDKQISSDAKFVTINPLPKDPDNMSFSGAVGDFKIKGFYKPSVKNPKLLLFNLSVDGEGNTKSAVFTPPGLPAGLEIYNEKTTRHDTLISSGIKTHIAYSFQIVANYRGGFNLPGMAFFFFDPFENKYKKFTSPPYKWLMDDGPALPWVKAAAYTQNADVYMKNSLTGSTKPMFYGSWLFYILLVVGFILNTAAFKMSSLKKITAKYKMMLKAKRAKNRTLRRIKKLLAASNGLHWDLFCKQLSAIFCQYIQEKINDDCHEISVLSFEARLLDKKLPECLYKQTVSLVNNINRQRFSAFKPYEPDKQQICNQLVIVVNSLSQNTYG